MLPLKNCGCKRYNTRGGSRQGAFGTPFFILGVLNSNKCPAALYFKVPFLILTVPQARTISLNWSWLSALNLIWFSLIILSLHVICSLQFVQLLNGLNKQDN